MGKKEIKGYKKKINIMDMVLVFLAFNMIVFCCDIPVIKGFEIYDHTGKDFMYDISMAFMTTIFIYFMQKKYMYLSNVKKYDKIVYMLYMDIVDCLKDMVLMITGNNDYLNVNKEIILSKLKDIDIDNIGSGRYENIDELLLKDAI